jgi:hypothetical protein
MAGQGIIVYGVSSGKGVKNLECKLAVEAQANADYPSSSGIPCDGIKDHTFHFNTTGDVCTFTPKFSFDGTFWRSGTAVALAAGGAKTARYPEHHAKYVKVTISSIGTVTTPFANCEWEGSP